MKSEEITTVIIECDDFVKFFLYPHEVHNFHYKDFINKTKCSPHHETFQKDSDIPWNGWIFRGQASPLWNLSPTIERTFSSLNIPLNKYHEREISLLREFQRTFYQYSNHIPDLNDYYEWFAIMQHSGAPTRFLDFTYTPFVAAFFAIENLNFSQEGEFCLWCIDKIWMEYKFKEFLPDFIKKQYEIDPLGKTIETQKIIMNNENPCNTIINISPFYLNERQQIQQGLFLFSTNLSKPLEQILFSMIDQEDEKNKIFKLVIKYTPGQIRKMINFMDKINISRRTLFPGLDGFAASLKLKSALAWLTPFI